MESIRTYENCTAEEFISAISQPHVEKRIVQGGPRTTTIFYSLLGRQIASVDIFYRRGKRIGESAFLYAEPTA